MNTDTPLMLDLREHLEICHSLLSMVERENSALRQPQPGLQSQFEDKSRLLPRLHDSLQRIRHHRLAWCKRTSRERAAEPAVPGLLREIQDLIMKIIVLDRENEQAFLRKGLVPARHLPAVDRQRPQVVAGLYQRQGQAR
jgi:hypothetical protein